MKRSSGTVQRISSKRAMTLVELVVAMALTAIFAAACVMLILPVVKIYTHSTDLARAQLLADTVANSLRSECTGNNIRYKGDVWITSEANARIDEADIDPQTSGDVLVIRKTDDYCETIASNYAINRSLYTSVFENDTSEEDATYVAETEGITSRAIYRMFAGTTGSEASASGHVHYGYFQAGTSTTSSYVFPREYYDFTDPLMYAAYDRYVVDLHFSGLSYHIDSEDETPAYVLCDIEIIQPGVGTVYTRQIALPFN
ncbi:prepilin-type N-terminal cleavage/methylation domain-containing protein [Ruminococcaceae bacterium YRB3002]|nr:prepilin-type N-terminal cleavage/methylation domain-containing protein [Ruminococcaceae bacterium YRB3002]